MADIQDARLRELAFLAQLEREGNSRVDSARLNQDYVFKSMVLHLLREGSINGIEWNYASVGFNVTTLANAGGRTNIEVQHEMRLWGDIARVLADQEVMARISHKGRLRRSELEQALQAGRDREPFGVLWAERHRDQAVVMAVLSAQPTAPVSVAYLDMNGLKTINDENDHAAGDAAIKTYLQTIDMLKGEQAEGFRSGGGDEVLVVMRNTSAEAAQRAMRDVLLQLSKECVRVGGKEVAPYLTAACGVVTTTDPTSDAATLIRRADAEQKRAKLASKAGAGAGSGPRASFLAMENAELETVP